MKRPDMTEAGGPDESDTPRLCCCWCDEVVAAAPRVQGPPVAVVSGGHYHRHCALGLCCCGRWVKRCPQRWRGRVADVGAATQPQGRQQAQPQSQPQQQQQPASGSPRLPPHPPTRLCCRCHRQPRLLLLLLSRRLPLLLWLHDRLSLCLPYLPATQLIFALLFLLWVL